MMVTEFVETVVEVDESVAIAAGVAALAALKGL